MSLLAVKDVAGADLALSSSHMMPVDELTENSLDSFVRQFIYAKRTVPDIGMTNFKFEVAMNETTATQAQSKFALYVLGKMSPSYDCWDRVTRWEPHEPN